MLGIGICWLATDTKTALCVIGGVLVLFLIAALAGGKNGKKCSSGSSGRPRVRIDHPHYMSDDESECSVCGTRFREKVMECPKCGARFGTATENQDEWFEEFDEECDMDEEEEER